MVSSVAALFESSLTKLTFEGALTSVLQWTVNVFLNLTSEWNFYRTHHRGKSICLSQNEFSGEKKDLMRFCRLSHRCCSDEASLLCVFWYDWSGWICDGNSEGRDYNDGFSLWRWCGWQSDVSRCPLSWRKNHIFQTSRTASPHGSTRHGRPDEPAAWNFSHIGRTEKFLTLSWTLFRCLFLPRVSPDRPHILFWWAVYALTLSAGLNNIPFWTF